MLFSKETQTKLPMTVIEIRPHRWGWKVFEAPGVEPVFRENSLRPIRFEALWR